MKYYIKINYNLWVWKKSSLFLEKSRSPQKEVKPNNVQYVERNSVQNINVKGIMLILYIDAREQCVINVHHLKDFPLMKKELLKKLFIDNVKYVKKRVIQLKSL